MTYTKSILNQKYFLNDKNIASSLVYDDILLNAIPSLDLVSSLYNKLSSEDKRLNDYLVSVETSAYTISSVVDARLIQLSDVLSTYSNTLCSNISTQVDSNRIADKKELSSVLSSYTDSRVLDLSTKLSSDIKDLSAGLCASVNAEFVHKAGDRINGSLTVDNVLSVTNETYLNGKTFIYGNIVHGKDTKVLGIDRGIVLGVSATVANEDAFVWSGNNDTENYTSHAQGTFNINPLTGAKGFYVGEQTLSDIVKNDVELTAAVLTSEIKAVSTSISSQVDANRASDKSELSNTLSTYANKLCSDLSVQIDNNRITDKTQLTYDLSTYSDQLWQNLSDTITNAKFANYDTFEFNSLTDNHIIEIVLKDNYAHSKTLSIDTTDFIKNRIVDHVLVVNPPEVSEPVLRIFWANASVGELTHTDIKIADLAKIYVKGDGINITPDLSIEVDSTVARTADLIDTRTTLNTLSGTTVPAISEHVDTIQAYVNELSNPSVSEPGILLQISNAITADIKDLKDLSVDSMNISSYFNSRLNTDRADIDSIKAFDDMLSIRVDDVDVGVIPTLSTKLDNIAKAIRTTANYAGKLQFNKYHPDFEKVEGEKVMLSDVFEYYGYGTLTNPIKNGNIYEVIFDLPKDSVKDDPLSDSYVFENPVFMADQYYDCKDFRLAHRDFIYVAVNDYTVEYVSLEDVATFAKTLAGCKLYEAGQAVVSALNTAVWLSGGNNATATWQSHVIRKENRPVIVLSTGHSIGGNNKFADGNNVFDGYNYIEILSAQSVNANSLSATDAKFNNMSAFDAKADQLSVFDSKANKLSAASISTDYLSGYQIVANWISAYRLSTDYLSANRVDLYDLSVGNNLSVSNKLSVYGDVNFKDGNFTISDERTTSKYKVDISNDFEVTGSLTVDTMLSVDQNTDIITLSADKFNSYADACFEKTVHLKNTLSVDDATYLDGAVTVKDDIATTLGGTLSVKKDATFDSNVEMKGDLTVDNALTATSDKVIVDDLSSGTLSADWTKVKHTTGYSLFDLSTALSNKIWIDDQINHDVNGTSDLSIVKISKEDYDNTVGLGTTPLCANTLYIIDSDYMDAYGQVLSNMTMTVDSIPSEAASEHYVQGVSALLSNEVKTVRNTFADLYREISTINSASYLSDVISAVVAIKDAIRQLTAY